MAGHLTRGGQASFHPALPLAYSSTTRVTPNHKALDFKRSCLADTFQHEPLQHPCDSSLSISLADNVSTGFIHSTTTQKNQKISAWEQTFRIRCNTASTAQTRINKSHAFPTTCFPSICSRHMLLLYSTTSCPLCVTLFPLHASPCSCMCRGQLSRHLGTALLCMNAISPVRKPM